MTSITPQQVKSRGRVWTVGIFSVLLIAVLLVAFFVYKSTASLSEALAEEVLEQQRDIGELLHEYSSVSLAVEKVRHSGQADHLAQLRDALNRASQQLKRMRSQYSFAQLDGAAKAHSYIKPVIEDVSYWIQNGLYGFEPNTEQVLLLASIRLQERYLNLRAISQETDQVAQSLISRQRKNIDTFRNFLLFLLTGIALLSLTIYSLLIRQRDLQIQLSEEQRGQSEVVIEAESRDRKKAEHALAVSEKMLRETLDAIPANIAMIDPEGLIVAANTPWKQVVTATGSKQKDGGIGIKFGDVYRALIDPETSGASRIYSSIGAVQSGQSDMLSREFMLESSDGRRWVEISAVPFTNNGERHTVLVHENITTRKQMEERDRRLRSDLAHVSRLTTAGELATGLAHELNQPLTAISHNCHSALASANDSDRPDAELIETLNDIYALSQRAGDIIRSMRRFTLKGSSEIVLTDINQLIKDTIRLTQPEAREKGVDVQLTLLEHVPQLRIDPVQIQQVLVNLERNSVEAMGHTRFPDKILNITTSMVAPGHIRISVSDTGQGLAPEILDTLFSTFQTTKKGSMGLGLSISRTIVEAHRGRLWVDHDQEFGATFHFTLPITVDAHSNHA